MKWGLSAHEGEVQQWIGLYFFLLCGLGVGNKESHFSSSPCALEQGILQVFLIVASSFIVCNDNISSGFSCHRLAIEKPLHLSVISRLSDCACGIYPECSYETATSLHLLPRLNISPF